MAAKEIRLPDGLDADTAADVLSEYASTEDAQITPKSRLEALEAEISEAKEAFAAVLSEESPQSADTLSRQDMDALTEPFRDDEGEIDVDTLRQEPQTEQVSGGSDGSSDDFSGDSLGLGTKEELDTLEKKRRTFESRGMDKRASEIESEMLELSGADDIETLEGEVF